MSAFTKPALLDGLKAVMLSLMIGALLVLLPLFSLLTAPLLPIPMAFIISRHGIVPGAIAAAVIGAVALALAGALGVPAAGGLILLLAAPAGIGAGICLKRGCSQLRLFVVLAALFFISLASLAGLLMVMTGRGPVAMVDYLTDSAADPAREIYLSVGMSQEDVDSLIADARDFAAALPYLAPALLLVLSVTLSGTSVAVARRVFDRLRQPFPRDFVFRDLRLHFAFAYMMIVGLLLELVTPYMPEPYSSAADLAGANLLIVSEVLFFVQGLAIASWFLWRYKVSRPKRVGVYACLVALQLALSLTSWMGLFDTWLDYRRRFGGRKAA